MGAFVLLVTIALNSTGLILLRMFSKTPDLGLMTVTLGYLPMAAGILLRRQRAPLAEAGSRPAWFWIAAWSFGITSIYALFLGFPRFLSVSQLIIAQSVTPLLAVFVSGDYFSGPATREPLRNLFPLVSLLALAALKSGQGPGHLFSFVLVCGAVFIVQTSMRKLARARRPLWVLPRFAAVNVAFLGLATLIMTAPRELPPLHLLFAAAAAGAILIAIHGGLLIGIEKTPPLLSALLISSSVPVSLLLEWALMDRPAGILEGALATAYLLGVGLQSLNRRKAEAPPEPRKKVS